MHVAKQHEVGINIERRKLEIRINTRIHLMERLVMIMDGKPSWGHVWTPTKMMLFHTKRLLHLVPDPWRMKVFNFRGQPRIWWSLRRGLL
jgi:hypothetical protein